ncbi:MAG: DivIVA domain-containing protein [Coriobacteriia bacterium]
MKLTPLDIHHKEFRHAMRGYSEEEVDGFLDGVAEEFERLLKENLELTEQIHTLTERLHTYQQMESTINNTLVTAQRSADEVVAKARFDAEGIKREAEGKATVIVHEALQGRQDALGELSKLRQAQAKFREDYRRLLTAQMDALGDSEVAMPADVEAVLGNDGARNAAPVSAQPAAAVAPAPAARVSQAAAAPAPVAAVAAAPVAAAVSQSAPEVAIAEPKPSPEPEPEAEEPQLLMEHVELTDPEEFEIPSLSALGEREDDIDIEEID